jgi:hypothetical protein
VHLQAMFCRFCAFSFNFVDFLVSLFQFLVHVFHVVNKIVVFCFSAQNQKKMERNEEKNCHEEM